MKLQDKENILRKWQELTKDLSLPDRVELVSNYLYAEGISVILTKKHFANEYKDDIIKNPERLLEIIKKYKNEFGETLEGALVHQSLIMWMWLEQE